MGSRKPLLLDLRRLCPLPPLPFPGDVLDGLPVWPLFCFGERLLEGGLPDELDHLLVPLTGGWLWNKQKMWYSEALNFAAMTRHSGPCSPFWHRGKMYTSAIESPSRASQMI